MIWTEVSCIFYGDAYSPALAEKSSRIVFIEKNEVGEKGCFGKYKDKPIPYGSSKLAPPFQMTKDNAGFGLEWLMRTISENRSQFEDAGASHLVLRLNVYHNGQCNFEFDEDQLRILGNARVDLAISCEQDEDYVERKLREVERIGRA